MTDARAPNARSYARDRAGQDRALQRIDERLRMVPSAWPETADAEPHRTIVILGGNTASIGSGVEGIVYASSVSPAAAYDPATTTVYPSGLGRGILFENGIEIGTVLVRHAWYGYTAPVLAGDIVRASGTTTLIYDPGGGGAVVTMTAYIFDWV